MFKYSSYAAVIGHASGKYNLGVERDPSGAAHANNTPGYRPSNASNYIFLFLAFRQMRYDLGLGKYGTHAADLAWSVGSGNHVAELIHLHTHQAVCKNFKKAAGAGGTFVVHFKLDNHSVVNFNNLAVLTAYVYYGFYVGIKLRRTNTVRYYFCYRLVSAQKRLSSVARRNNSTEIVPGCADFLQGGIKNPLSTFVSVGKSVVSVEYELFFVFVQNHTFACG